MLINGFTTAMTNHHSVAIGFADAPYGSCRQLHAFAFSFFRQCFALVHHDPYHSVVAPSLRSGTARLRREQKRKALLIQADRRSRKRKK
ncbi:hypothetical protein HXT04_07670 [Treponema parvum]|nr:hypothetical protein HXT04_07670 [Treponema parvum]